MFKVGLTFFINKDSATFSKVLFRLTLPIILLKLFYFRVLIAFFSIACLSRWDLAFLPLCSCTLSDNLCAFFPPGKACHWKNPKNLKVEDFNVIGKGYKNNTFKRKVTDFLLIKGVKPTLNTHEKSVPLYLFNWCEVFMFPLPYEENLETFLCAIFLELSFFFFSFLLFFYQNDIAITRKTRKFVHSP